MSSSYPYKGANLTPYATLDKARKTRTAHGLRQCLCVAKARVDDANKMGWTALAQSWQRDVDEIQNLLSLAEWERRAA